MTTVAYITNSSPQSGVGHRAAALALHLAAQPEVSLLRYHLDGGTGALTTDGAVTARLTPLPGIFGRKSLSWMRLGRPTRRAFSQQPLDIVDLTNQTLSFLVPRRHTGSRPAYITTVHDSIELTEPQTRTGRLLATYLYGGIARSTHLIAVSEYTARTIREQFNVSPQDITVIPNGVGPEFHLIPNFSDSVAARALRTELKIPESARMVLAVGSEHPRKNMRVALSAFAKAVAKLPDLVFVKVGEPGIPAGRTELLATIDELRLREQVRLLGTVSELRLNELYNAASVLIFPSRAEGFGLPPLQSMAAGTPVVASNATAIPEVVGSAALLHDPDDTEAFAKSLVQVLTDSALAARLRAAGRAQSAKFSWEAATAKQLQVYQRVSTTR